MTFPTASQASTYAFAMGRTLAKTLSERLPSDISFMCGQIPDLQGHLFPEEEAEIVRAVPIRKATFRAGRCCARAALARFGSANCPIARAEDGSPIWPSDVIGAITHTNKMCVTIVSLRQFWLGLGIDLETSCPLDADLVDIVCCSEELMQFSTFGHPIGFDLPKLIFVIKEAIFKAYYPSTRTYLDFLDVIVRVDLNQASFQAEIRRSDRPPVYGRRTFSGWWEEVEGHFLAVTTIPVREL